MTTTAPQAAAPTANRIETLDFIRGCALFGILLMNITAFGMPQAYVNPGNYGGASGADLWAWIITQTGFEGTQRGLFSLLFGAGVILLTSRLEASGRSDAADIYFRRNLWLVGLGMVNAFLFLWPGDILYCYGITALFIFAFRKLSARSLLAIGIAGLVIGSAWNGFDAQRLLGKHEAYAAAVDARTRAHALTSQQNEAITAWEEARTDFEAPRERIEKALEGHRNGYFHALAYLAPINAEAQSWYMYRWFFDVFAMMLIGMALFRWGVLTLDRPPSLYATMAVAGYGVGLAVRIWQVRWIIDHRFSALAFAEANVSYDLGRLPMTMGHLGTLLLFVRSGALSWLRRSLAAVGQMALTSYLTHSIACAFLFVGLRLYGHLARHELYYVVFSIWAVQLVLSPLWLRHFRFGPAEWLWRYLTYLKRPPFRRGGVETSEPGAARGAAIASGL
jgi:uncharacterized protein